MRAMEAGRVLGGKYELVRLLGRGSMGQVWVAHHRTLREAVALKLLAAPAPLGGEPEHPSTSAARFRFEAQVAARLSRKTRHIVRVTDHGEEENGLAYLVMELLEGETLEQLLLQHGALSPPDAAKLVLQMARALEQAHAESIIHRDLKPANVFMTRDEDGGMLVKLLDFGIARAIRTQRVPPSFATGEGLIFGTPGYMSPEQACASKLDARCDLWALATVGYEALTGHLPVGGACTEELLKNLQAGHLIPVHERNPDAPPDLSAFFERAFARQIDQRFATASQLALAFEQAASSVAVPLRTIPLPTDAARLAVRGDTLLAVRPPSGRTPKFRGKWARLAFLAPASLLGLAVGALAWRGSASSPASAGAATASTADDRSPSRPHRPSSIAQVAEDTALFALPSTLDTPDVVLLPEAPASPALSAAAVPGAVASAVTSKVAAPQAPAPPTTTASAPLLPAVPSPLPSAAPGSRKPMDKSAVL